ncbi:hypothetical protein TNCV_167381 [Trichonephila clavipes]|nr:hypothetical protein TNCV_167381 [Trichonephila clavipes]
MAGSQGLKGGLVFAMKFEQPSKHTKGQTPPYRQSRRSDTSGWTEIIVPGYIGNDVSFNSGLIGSAENKANGLLIASTLVDLSRKTIPVRICNVTEKPRVFQKGGEVLATCSPVTCLQKGELAPYPTRLNSVDYRPSRKY